MNFLLITNQCITDTTTGVAHSLRQMMIWLAEAGHDCRCLCTARFETKVTLDLKEHVAAWDDTYSVDDTTSPCPVYRFDMEGVNVHLIHTQHNVESQPDDSEVGQFRGLLSSMVRESKPDVLIALNSHPMIFASMAWAQKQGIRTAYAVRGYGYEDPRYFEHVDHAFTCSEFLTQHYREKAGIHSTPLEPPIDWSTVEAPDEHRRFVTFINPMPTKGLVLFARLADMLGQRRPDIPILIIQSGMSAGHLNHIAGLELKKYPHILVGPATSQPWEIYALTRILLVPSVWPEPFGRVAVEAMINGIPPLVSDRGALPGVVGGDASKGGAGLVLPLPDWLTPAEPRLPTEAEVQLWFDAICKLWDDPAWYAELSQRGRALAESRYSQEASFDKHVKYFEHIAAQARPSVFVD